MTYYGDPREDVDSLLSRWVVTGELGPAPKGGWTFPRVARQIRKEMADTVKKRVRSAAGRHKQGWEYIDLESLDRYLDEAVDDANG